MRTILIILTIITSSNLIGQVQGIYNGKEIYTTVIENNGDNKELYNHKQIALNTDSSFVFWRTYRTSNAICEGCIDTIWISGNWSQQNDTIILNSIYSAKDFIEIRDFVSTIKSYVFVYNTSHFCYNSDKIIINDSISFDINCAEVVLKDFDTIYSIKFVKYIDKTFLYEYIYSPINFNPKLFTINELSCNRSKYNDSFIINEKLIIIKDMLRPVNGNSIIQAENGYKKLL